VRASLSNIATQNRHKHREPSMRLQCAGL
jgi:hypothetical protein